MARDEKEDEAQETQEAPAKKSGIMLKWIIIGAVLLGIVAAAVGGGLYYFRGVETAKKKPQAPPPIIGTLWPMEPYIVNLRDNNGERYLKVVLQLEMSDTGAALGTQPSQAEIAGQHVGSPIGEIISGAPGVQWQAETAEVS